MAKKQTKEIEFNSVILDSVFEDVMHNSMMPYSESVILDRAIPRVEDGLKPVQRRVLFSMHEMGLTPDKPHKKCAKIVGDCLGKYHPHGDSSVYGALVRLAQPFAMRMKLVDGHGNFGSVDGDSAAAYRYTEARMSPLALEMLRDIDKETVVWQPNFDDSAEEPTTLPGRFPNLLVNGSNGIAVGLATNIPTHNMGECIDAVVMQIDNPNCSTKELLEVFHGPDFPTGGFIIPVDSMESIYETGKGKIIIRSRLHIENDDNGKKNIIITEIPYQVSKSELLERIAALKEQNKELLSGIADVVDESDKTGNRAVIKLKRDADAKKIISFLMKKTNLEMNYSINMVAIANGKPEQLSLKAYLKYYVEYQRQIIVKRSTYDLKAAKARAEIVRGLLVAIRNIDEVIRIIKESESTAKAKDALRQSFDLSDVQAQAILDMRLKSLAKLEVGKLEEELANLEKTIARLQAILDSKRKQLAVVKDELLEIKKAQSSPRMSVIISNEEQAENYSAPSAAEAVEYRDGIIVLNNDGLLRFMSQKSFTTSAKDYTTIDKEALPVQALSVNNKGNLYAFTNFGNLVKIDVTNLPEKRLKEKAYKVGTLNQDVKTGEKIVKLIFFDGAPIGELILFTRQGAVKRVDLSEFTETVKTYMQAIILADGDELINAEVVNDDLSVMEVSSDGQVLIYSAVEVPIQGKKAAGVKGMKLNDKATVVFGGQVEEEGEIVVATSNGYLKRVITSTIDPSSRYLKGVKLVELEKGSVRFISTVKMPYDLAFVSGEEVKVMNTEDIRLDTRTTKGKQIFRNAPIDFVVKVAEF
ncbi:MAG: DNA topoisomerase 4 subunit A [Clostridia bacterium]|nr:DNA topoisomerase 4 subunit A [Clostridia bacterium]